MNIEKKIFKKMAEYYARYNLSSEIKECLDRTLFDSFDVEITCALVQGYLVGTKQRKLSDFSRDYIKAWGPVCEEGRGGVL